MAFGLRFENLENMSIKEKISRGEFFCAPGIQDMITAVIAKDVGFDAVYASGYWMGASAHGVPDAGITTYTQMVDRVETLVNTIGSAEVIADADTGYGGLLNVRETVRGYEKAGAKVIQFEDQEFPKKCGHTKNKRVVDSETMAMKIRVAVDSCTGPDTMIVARTDAYQIEGLDGVMRRLESYVEAGADILFPEALSTDEEMRKVCNEFDVPIMANMADGGKTPIRDSQTLADIGFAFSIFPAAASLAAAAAVKQLLSLLKATGTSLHDEVPLYDFTEFCKQIGFEDVWAFEEKWREQG